MIIFDQESLLIVQLDLLRLDLLLESIDEFLVIVIDLPLSIDLSMFLLQYLQLLAVCIDLLSLFFLGLLCLFLSNLFLLFLISLINGDFDREFFLSKLLFDLEARFIPLDDTLLAKSVPWNGIVFGEGIVTIRTEQEVLVDTILLVFVQSMRRG